MDCHVPEFESGSVCVSEFVQLNVGSGNADDAGMTFDKGLIYNAALFQMRRLAEAAN